jgi:hypothetical protein
MSNTVGGFNFAMLKVCIITVVFVELKFYDCSKRIVSYCKMIAVVLILLENS